MTINGNFSICKGDEAALRARDFVKSLEGMTFAEALRATKYATCILEEVLREYSKECTLGEIDFKIMIC